ncbi:MAG: sensor domain-containing diguanylate cyclase [Candidatus Adiutrix sp.]|nr:sensor domain-containing diguanylate cyclase [Candidatus Adiutrix sp.]
MAAFFSSIILCGVLLVVMVGNKAHLDRLRMEQLIDEKSVQLTEIIHKLLYKTEALSALVIQNDGEVSNFDRVAATLVDDPAIINVILAPGGIVSHVYPLTGNEGVLGFNYFSVSLGNTEARLAKETGQLVFGGPFQLVQGGQALVGRLPVYIDEPGQGKTFWGLVSVTLKYPRILDGLGLSLLKNQGYAFEIWRVNPDTGDRQVIAHSGYEYNKKAPFIEKKVEILNAAWYFRLAPVTMWYQYRETWFLLFFGLFASCLLGFVVQNNSQLKRMQLYMEEIVWKDTLTGIANRRHFMDTAPRHLQLAGRNKQDSFVIIFDVDHFKKTNDTYGHAAGDMVLSSIAERVNKIIRPYDVFARYGGEEFILLVTNVNQEEAEQCAQRMRLGICDSPVVFNGMEIPTSASFGLARVSPQSSLDTAIRQADEALCAAKKAGRNTSVCYKPSDTPSE